MGTVYDVRLQNARQLIEELAGGVLAEFERKYGISANYLGQITQEFRPMGAKFARRIEQAVGLGEGQMDLPNLGQPLAPGPAVGVSKGVPIVGRAALLIGEDGYFVEEDYPAGHGDGLIDHPTRDPNAYSLRVVGDSMMPALRSGWFIVVEPNLPPVVGEFVHVLTKKGQHMIKEFLHQKEGSVVLNSINGSVRLTVPLAELEYIRPVTGYYPPSKRRL